MTTARLGALLWASLVLGGEGGGCIGGARKRGRSGGEARAIGGGAASKCTDGGGSGHDGGRVGEGGLRGGGGRGNSCCR
jgi:hypothetical protein